MARIHMLSLLSIIMVVMAATVDVTPDRTKMVGRKPSSRLIEAHNHEVEAQSETSLSTVIATGANTARRVRPDNPADNRCRGGDTALSEPHFQISVIGIIGKNHRGFHRFSSGFHRFSSVLAPNTRRRHC